MRLTAASTALLVAQARQTLATRASRARATATATATTSNKGTIESSKHGTKLSGTQEDPGSSESLQIETKLERKQTAVGKLVEKVKTRRKNKVHEDEEVHTPPDLGVLGLGHRLKHSNRAVHQNSGADVPKESNANEIPRKLVDNNNIIPGAAEENDFLMSTLYYICDSPVCDCEDFDFESIQGHIGCNTEAIQVGGYCGSTINYCGEEVEICYRETLSVEAFGPQDYTYTTCTTYTDPYQQHVCATFQSSSGDDNDIDTTSEVVFSESGVSDIVKESKSSAPCGVFFNHQQCNSCSTEIRTYERSFLDSETGESYSLSSYQTRCFEVDCSNVVGGNHVVNTCDNELATLRDNVVFGDVCTRCPPCGMGYEMTKRSAMGNFPVIGNYQCSGLELGAMTGFFSRDVCPELQSRTWEYCGCEPIFYDPSLVAGVPEPDKKENEPDANHDDDDDDDGIDEPPFNNRTSQDKDHHVPRGGANAMFILPGDTTGAASCNLCGSHGAKVAKPDNLVELPNGTTTTCSALEGAGRLGMMTSDYCKLFAMPLVFSKCGGCAEWGIGESIMEGQPHYNRGDPSTRAAWNKYSSDADADADPQPFARSYREDPEEIDVVSPGGSDNETATPPNGVSSSTASSAPKSWDSRIVSSSILLVPAILLFWVSL